MENKLKIFLTAFIFSVFWNGWGFSYAQAGPNLTVYPLTPIFTINNALPGDEFESAPISIQNNGTENEQVQFKISVTTDPEEKTGAGYKRR